MYLEIYSNYLDTFLHKDTVSGIEMHLLPCLRSHEAHLEALDHLLSLLHCLLTSPRLPLPAIAAAILASPRALQLPLALGTSPLLHESAIKCLP